MSAVHFLSLRELFDQLNLVGFLRFLHQGNRLGAGEREPLDPEIFLDDLLHFRFQRGERRGIEGHLGIEIVVEAVFNGRSDRQLGGWVKTLDRLREDMGSGMVENMLPLVVFESQERDLRVGRQFPGQIDRFSVHQRCESFTGCQTRFLGGFIDGKRRLKRQLLILK